MALPDYFKNEAGTPITWINTGGTYAITLTSVVNNGGWQGAKGDLGATRAKTWELVIQSAVAVAAIAGTELEVYWAASASATVSTDNPGGTSGTDAAYSTTSKVDEYKRQLIYVGGLILTNDAGTGVQAQRLIFAPPTRYGMPVVVNKTGQALSGTAANHKITLIPIEESITDTV